MARTDTKGEIGLEGTLLAQRNDKGQPVNWLPFPVVSGEKKKKKSQAENTILLKWGKFNREERSQSKERKLSQRECRLITKGNGRAQKTEIGKLSCKGNQRNPIACIIKHRYRAVESIPEVMEEEKRGLSGDTELSRGKS